MGNKPGALTMTVCVRKGFRTLFVSALPMNPLPIGGSLWLHIVVRAQDIANTFEHIFYLDEGSRHR
jgi:hypothetical protein